MPELPEVETALRGIKPYIVGEKVKDVILRFPRLRWPIPEQLPQLIVGHTLKSVVRRGKYLIFRFDHGALILHLGMSGNLRIVNHDVAVKKHDHVDITFSNGKSLRFNDPRRFGALLWAENDVHEHKLLSQLGPEPLTATFSSEYLWKQTRGRAASIKTCLMNGRIVAGIGNIYAAEALFLAGINPKKTANKLSKLDCQHLAEAIKAVLKKAIKKGGTTLRDFADAHGKPGYFKLELLVYGRQGQACPRCANKLKTIVIAQRSTVFCTKCQK